MTVRRRRGSSRETTAHWGSPTTSSLLEIHSARTWTGIAPAMFSHTVLQSAAALGTPSTAPDRQHPTTYMIAAQESDNSIPVAAQEAMAANADQVVRLPAAHMVQLSRPDDLADALGRI